MAFGRALSSLLKKEESAQSANVAVRAQTRFLISTEITSRPASLIFMCTALWVVTAWQLLQKRRLNFSTDAFRVYGRHTHTWKEDAEEGSALSMRSITYTFNSISSAPRRGIYRVGGLTELTLSETQIGCELIAAGRRASATL